MWTSKRVGVKCPQCGGDVDLNIRMFAKQIGEFSLPGVQLKLSTEAFPVLECVGNWEPPLGEPMWPECEWMVKGSFDGEGSALFAAW